MVRTCGVTDCQIGESTTVVWNAIARVTYVHESGKWADVKLVHGGAHATLLSYSADDYRDRMHDLLGAEAEFVVFKWDVVHDPVVTPISDFRFDKGDLNAQEEKA